jgi:hypothetical protein
MQREDEMGGGSGGISSIDLSKLTSAAEERLKQLAQAGTHILFACEAADRKALDSHLARSTIFDGKKCDVTDGSAGEAYKGLMVKSSIVIAFTDGTRNTEFLDQIIELAFQAKKQGIHAKANDNSKIPAKASAYRWPSLLWDKVEKMFE